jgi:hypothetical protein
MVVIPVKQKIEASLVARFAGARCIGASGIPCQSFSCGRRDPVEVVYVDLVRKELQNGVREVR